jgi:5-methylcytosine-specific restriction endonuclease McrA
VGLINLIAEVDARKLYAREAKPSMFLYCTEVLHLSEQEAYLRITVARASREHPSLLAMLRDGRLHLSGIARLTKYLTRKNRDEVLKLAVHKSRREIEKLIAELEPCPDVPPAMRKLPTRRAEAPPPASGAIEAQRAGSAVPGSAAAGSAGGGAAPSDTAGGPGRELCLDRVERAGEELCLDRVGATPRAPSARPATVQPLAPARYKVEFTASAELHDKLQRLQALMRSSVPDGDLAKIIDDAVTEKLERLEARRFARTRSPRKSLAETDTTPASRHIPAAVRRAVHQRDGGRCTYQDARGRRCTARDRLEFHHHRQPFGRGGEHSVYNVRLMCRVHNQLLAEQDYGEEKMARFRRGPGRVSETRGIGAKHERRPAVKQSRTS